MKTILLAGYRFEPNVEHSPGLDRGADGTLTLDRRIQQLRTLNQDVICVLSGPSAEAAVRDSRHLGDVDLVYDTNDEAVNLITNLRAGLAAAGRDACFVLPVEIPCPAAEEWRHLALSSLSAGPRVSLAQLRREGDPSDGLKDFGFPLLVTRFGVGEIPRLTGLTSLVDARLEYLYPSI